MIVIVGASKGLGKELSNIFHKKKLLLISRSKIQLENPEHKSLTEDINNLEFSMIDAIIGDNKIEGVFFVVGKIYKNDNFNLSEKEVSDIIKTNFASVVRLSEKFISYGKLEDNCLLCYCSSVSTFLPRGKQAIYCASKTALNSYYYSLNAHLDKGIKRIRTALLILGYMDTEMSKDVKTFLPKKNPKEIALIIFKKFHNLNGKYYIPFYWFFIDITLKLIPRYVKKKLFNILEI